MTNHIIMPDLGQTIAEGKIARWLKKPGDRIAKGEPLLEVETDKATVEVEAYRAGYLRELLASEGQMVGAMTPIAILTDTPTEPYKRHSGGDNSETPAGTLTGAAGSPISPADAYAPISETGKVAASPAARLRAGELRADLRRAVATGPEGLIVNRDVERLAVGRAGRKRASAMAAITAESVQSIPHFYVTVEFDVSSLLRWREDWNARHPDLHASINDIFVRAASQALQDVPGMNVLYRDGWIEEVTAADVLQVTATDRGLILVPISEPAAVGWEEHQRNMRTVREQAARGSLTAFSVSKQSPALAISNLGMFGVKQFTAIIPPGSTAVLAVGSVRQEPIVRSRRVEIGAVCSLTLSADHRAVDGITAAKFLQSIQEHLNSL